MIRSSNPSRSRVLLIISAHNFRVIRSSRLRHMVRFFAHENVISPFSSLTSERREIVRCACGFPSSSCMAAVTTRSCETNRVCINSRKSSIETSDGNSRGRAITAVMAVRAESIYFSRASRLCGKRSIAYSSSKLSILSQIVISRNSSLAHVGENVSDQTTSVFRFS